MSHKKFSYRTIHAPSELFLQRIVDPQLRIFDSKQDRPDQQQRQHARTQRRYVYFDTVHSIQRLFFLLQNANLSEATALRVQKPRTNMTKLRATSNTMNDPHCRIWSWSRALEYTIVRSIESPTHFVLQKKGIVSLCGLTPSVVHHER